MARPISSADAKRVIEAHQFLNKNLLSAFEMHDNLTENIVHATNALITSETLSLLRNIPIDEINREKSGFRIKALRDNGYQTIADIAPASVYRLSSIYGISDDAANSIKQVVDKIVSTTREGVKIKISADNKSDMISQLILAISRFKQSEAYVDECKKIFNSSYQNVEKYLQNLAPASSGIKWFLTSKAKKNTATEAYNVLVEMLNSGYVQHINSNVEAIRNLRYLRVDEAWQDFSENSIRFFNILEDIVPGVLGEDDTICGLPEELAKEIQDQDYFLDGLFCELRRYQEWGVKYILHQERVLLGDEMGLGKTIQAIASMVSLKNTGATHFMVVCTSIVLANWCREIKKMSKLSVVKIYGADRVAALESWKETGGVAVTTYETTGSFDLEEDFKFSMLVVDEAHYIKNPDARRTRNVTNISYHAERLLFMTGTALENKVEEMISLIKVLQPQVASKVRGMEFLSSAPQFREAVAPVYYRRKREDVLTELPDLIETQEWCSMNAVEEQAYEKSVLSSNIMAARRVSWNVDDLKDSSKATRLMEIVSEATEEGRKVIVFSFFLDTIRTIGSHLGDQCYGPINGSISPQRRQEIIDEFDSAPAGSVLVAQIQAGGTGLNIQSASVVVICEPQFKPSIENQAISRAYRMGQTRNVLVYRLLCENSVDEKITDLLATKQEIFDAFADESVIAEKNKELDEKAFGNIIKEEIERINAKQGNKTT